MDAVFHAKRLVGRWSSHRLELGRRWLNIGEPIVSYYTPDELDAMMARLPEGRVADRRFIKAKRFGFLHRYSIGFIVEKAM